jgi:hypothetical protein
MEPHSSVEHALVIRNAEENIGKNLLQHFDDEDDEEDEGVKEKSNSLVSYKPDLPMPSLAWKEKK